jgi:F5/8 type C domain
MLVTWWMPLALLGLHRYYGDGAKPAEARSARAGLVLFGISWLLQALTNGYYLFYFPILIALWIVVFTNWRSDARRAAAVAGAWILSSVPLIPVLLEYYAVQTSLGLGRTRSEIQLYSASIDSFLQATQLLRFWRLSDGQTMEDRLFPGVTVLAVVGAGLLVRRWRGHEGRRFLFYLGAAALTASLTLGWLPVFPGVRVPARFFMLTTLCLAIAAGLAVAALNAAYPRYATVTTCLVAAGLVADGWIVAMPLGPPPRRFATTLARNAVVLELPVTDANVNVAAMYRGTLHGRPVVNGYAGYVPPHASVIDWALVRKDPSILTELRRGRPLYVVVALHPESSTWSRFIEAQNDVKRLEIGGAGTLYELPPAPFARQVTIGRPHAATGADRNDGWLTVDLGAERSIRAVELRTRGHVVLLRATLRVETSADGVAWTVAADEPTGGLAFTGALADPRGVPVRVVLPDVRARFVRLDTPAFTAADVTVYAPG